MAVRRTPALPLPIVHRQNFFLTSTGELVYFTQQNIVSHSELIWQERAGVTHSIADRESSSMRSLERALHLLAVIEDGGNQLGLTDLSRTSELSKATVIRILAVLEKYGFVDKRNGRYRLGPAVLSLANAYVLGNELTKVAFSVLQELAHASEETASLFVRLGFKRVLVQRVEGAHPLRFVLPIGERLPLHVGAGKVLAAAMSGEEINQMLDELGEIRLANGQPVSREAMLAELARVREQGFAVSLGERMLGLVAVAAPVIDADGVTIASVSLAAAKERMTPEKIDRFSILVRDAARAISEGWQKS